MIKILISGIFGHMGRNVAELVDADQNCELLCGVDLKEGEMYGAPVYASFADVREKADAVIDFSNAANLKNILAYAEKFCVPVVLAATGYTADDLEAIEKASQKIAVFKTANLSVGINLLQKLVKEAAAFLGDQFDIEIVEKHHNLKKDAPSGTALEMGRRVAQGRGVDFDSVAVLSREGHTGERPDGAIGFAALRGGDVVGDHTVIFAGPGERIEISHKSGSRAGYAQGAVTAARFLKDKPNGLFSMSDVLGFN